LQQSLGAVERLLEIDLDTVELYSRVGEEGEPSLLTDHILRLSGQLAEMKAALEGGDLVMLGDILDYEFSDLTETWGAILGELADRFDATGE